MRNFYLMIFAVVTLAGMLAISGCKKDESTAQDDALGNQGTLTVSGTFNGHNYVDLGLPSSILWATCNVGANSPEGYGDYFAWGETTTKETYTPVNYIYRYAEASILWEIDSSLTKYCNISIYGNHGYTDNLTTLEASDDVATANWGAGWRMPTREEMQELFDNCTHEWTTQNGVNGRKFTGPNGNSIFLPATGLRSGDSLHDAGSYGCYWSSSLETRYPLGAWYLIFFSDSCGMRHHFRCCGITVRPVCVR